MLPLRTKAGSLPLPPPTAPATAVPMNANEIPYGPLPGVAEALIAAVSGVHRYPDMAVTALRQRLAGYLDLDPARIATGCGSVGLLEHLIVAYCRPGDEVVFSWPSFEAYPMVCAVAGAVGVAVPNTPGHKHDLAAMAAPIGDRTRIVIVCNPNNPTGVAVHREELAAFLDAVPPSVLVVLDEAYREFVTDPRIPDGLAEHGHRENVVVLRTLSKAWGLAGLRVGYLLGSVSTIDRVRRGVTAFSVNALAQVAGVAALDAAGEMRRRVALVTAERERVLTALQAVAPDVPASQGNFAWLPVGDRAAEMVARCRAEGVLIRPFAGLGARATVGTPEQNDLLLSVLTPQLTA